ncbi:hypothetical protein ABES25_02595 [Bacillus gobiensis]|uniref:hypothetical protein n=1 Tax=Bacillus gobiensis TaxID=1441095 RepID=UPI003D1C30A9
MDTQTISNNKSECYNFCTLTGKDYVVRVIALHHSLQRHAAHFKLWICCIDDVSYNLLLRMDLQDVVVFRLDAFSDERVHQMRNERNVAEFCWTLKSILIEHLLTENDIDSIIYCDGDIYFFSDPKDIFDDWGESSVYLCPQRDYAYVEQTYGKYQAGLIGFKNDQYGLEGLRWWKERCLEWCSAQPDGERFGDQKYLDTLAVAFQNIKVSTHIGVDAAPWNCVYGDNYFHIHVIDNQVYLNNSKLVAFHFSSISMFSEDDFDLWTITPLHISDVIMYHIYVPYLTKIREVMKEVKEIDENTWLATLAPYYGGDQVKNYYRYPSY